MKPARALHLEDTAFALLAAGVLLGLPGFVVLLGFLR